MRDAEVEAVVEAVLRSRKYRHVLRDVVVRLATHALRVQGRPPRQAVASVKRALHQAYGAFGGGGFPLPRMRRELQQALACDGAERRAALIALMRHHTSTRERAPVVEHFYAKLFAGDVPCRVLDLGCGLNGLSLPLWPPGQTRYHGVDIDASLLSFVAEALSALSVDHELSCRDLAGDAPLPAAEVALMLKLYPTLEQQAPGSGAALIERLDVGRVVVSFPVQSLGRRQVGMREHYRVQFGELAARRRWRTRELSFGEELVYVVDKGLPTSAAPAVPSQSGPAALPPDC